MCVCVCERCSVCVSVHVCVCAHACACVCVRVGVAGGGEPRRERAPLSRPSCCPAPHLPTARARMLPPPLTPLAPDPSHRSAITFWPSDACNSRGCLPSPFLTPARSSRPDYWPSRATLLPGFSLAFFNSLPLQMDLPKVQL